jgi:hypothetical protein
MPRTIPAIKGIRRRRKGPFFQRLTNILTNNGLIEIKAFLHKINKRLIISSFL